MSVTRDLIDEAKRIRQKLRYPPNSVPDAGINLTRLSTAYKGDIPPPDTPPKKPLFVEPPPQVLIEEIKFPIKFEDIIKAVARHYGLEKDEIAGPKRHAPLVMARKVVIYLSLRLLQNRSLTGIGRGLKKDHSTMIHANKRIKQEILINPGMVDELEEIEERLVRDSRRFTVSNFCERHLAQPSRPAAGGDEEPGVPLLDQGSPQAMDDPKTRQQAEVHQWSLFPEDHPQSTGQTPPRSWKL